MRAARIVGDEAIAIIIEPEEFERVKDALMTPAWASHPIAGSMWHAVNGDLHFDLLYEDQRDIPSEPTTLDDIEVNWMGDDSWGQAPA